MLYEAPAICEDLLICHNYGPDCGRKDTARDQQVIFFHKASDFVPMVVTIAVSTYYSQVLEALEAHF